MGLTLEKSSSLGLTLEKSPSLRLTLEKSPSLVRTQPQPQRSPQWRPPQQRRKRISRQKKKHQGRQASWRLASEWPPGRTSQSEVPHSDGTHGAINLGWISRVLEDPMPQGQAALRWRSLFSICITLTYYNKWQSRLDHGNTNTVASLSAER